ncbi:MULTISPECIES: hypothetical protein [unclassified Saccharothrix]|uniref:hypothetical protein n=1 Tax=unclassified Saccharothrix TaxID=2593673 RepID=UPI00307D0279
MAEDIERHLTAVDDALNAADAALTAEVARVVDVEAALERVKRAGLRRVTTALDEVDIAAAPPIIGL